MSASLPETIKVWTTVFHSENIKGKPSVTNGHEKNSIFRQCHSLINIGCIVGLPKVYLFREISEIICLSKNCIFEPKQVFVTFLLQKV